MVKNKWSNWLECIFIRSNQREYVFRAKRLVKISTINQLVKKHSSMSMIIKLWSSENKNHSPLSNKGWVLPDGLYAWKSEFGSNTNRDCYRMIPDRHPKNSSTRTVTQPPWNWSFRVFNKKPEILLHRWRMRVAHSSEALGLLPVGPSGKVTRKGFL